MVQAAQAPQASTRHQDAPLVLGRERITADLGLAPTALTATEAKDAFDHSIYGRNLESGLLRRIVNLAIEKGVKLSELQFDVSLGEVNELRQVLKSSGWKNQELSQLLVLQGADTKREGLTVTLGKTLLSHLEDRMLDHDARTGNCVSKIVRDEIKKDFLNSRGGLIRFRAREAEVLFKDSPLKSTVAEGKLIRGLVNIARNSSIDGASWRMSSENALGWKQTIMQSTGLTSEADLNRLIVFKDNKDGSCSLSLGENLKPFVKQRLIEFSEQQLGHSVLCSKFRQFDRIC